MGYSLHAELFGSYAVGLMVIALRLFVRWSSGSHNFYWDDLCLGSVVVWWTMHTVFLYLLDNTGSNIGLNEKSAMEVPDSEVHKLQQGGIFAFLAWISYICLVWSFKGVLMFLYNRITTGLWQHRMTLIMGAFCVCTFLASLIFDLAVCHPIQKNWQVKPYAGGKHLVSVVGFPYAQLTNTQKTTNRTDLGVMCVPLPLIIAAKIPPLQKFILALLFSSGIFVMIAAVLRTYYSISNINKLSVALGWASREALVSVFVVCAPGIKPLFARFKWFQSFKSSSNGYSSNQRTGRNGMFHSKSGNFTGINSTKDEGKHPYELDIMKRNKDKHDDSSNESQERIIESGEDANSPPRDHAGIVVTTEYTLAHDDRGSAT
ncbi:uncharacterized protein ASPGLDRAFT_1502724 [Aspergillus glaucus CBS 516.65]|uniref:Rhodopsin domain-containing protein n=1 Tax=Aspergillus glaucus CBS 516.65 TaxID=1160497 RepID=A0A1L9V8F5_ASPGL|nr:hypothetical protein ASPGLDRAFT_1502724 [Aspergillus glaucus CBS 516.65]OJJ80132.1 hypothetical protein ASPGLDRAFT_1502724 [Aspergillus glaucus CBS 516.65]